MRTKDYIETFGDGNGQCQGQDNSFNDMLYSMSVDQGTMLEVYKFSSVQFGIEFFLVTHRKKAEIS